MARFEDSLGLFGSEECGGTSSEIGCQLCGTIHNKGIAKEEEKEGERVDYVQFGDWVVCDCCFEKVEQAVLTNITDIISWFIRILKARRRDLLKREAVIHELDDALSDFFRDLDKSSAAGPATKSGS